MRCPSCGARLVEIVRSGVKLDRCPECHGIWLDRGELDRVLDRERGGAPHHPSPPPDESGAHAEGRRTRPTNFLELLEALAFFV